MSTSWSWGIPFLLQIGFSLFALPMACWCPESPRWLVDNNQLEKARAILARYHAGGDVTAQVVHFQLEEISASIEAEKEASISSRWIDMLKTSGNRHRFNISVTLGIFSQWNGVYVNFLLNLHLLKTKLLHLAASCHTT